MTTLTEQVYPTESLISEAPGERSREKVIFSSGAVVKACAILGAVQTGTPTAAAGTPLSGTGGTVGNGVISALTADAGAMAGLWQLECTVTGATGKFKVIKPDGSIDGILTIGTPYNGTINISVADGSNDWLVGDIIPVTVTYLNGQSVLKYEALDTAATDGSQIAAGISYGTYDAASADATGVAYVRACEHNADIVVWPAGITANQKAVATAQLAALGISLR